MNESIVILLIQEDPEGNEWIRVALEQDLDSPFRLQCVERLPTALARLSGGGVDLILLDLPQGSGSDRLETVLKLRRDAPHTPLLIVCAAQDEGLALRAMRAGAADYVIKESAESGLGPAVRAAIAWGRNLAPSGNSTGSRSGGIIAIVGAKGGVGATTVALNVASSLAQRNKVILAEIRPVFGTLSQYFQPVGRIRNLSHLLDEDSGMITEAEASKCLWRTEHLPRLDVLFGPQTATECREISADHARAISRTLEGLAQHVIIDLPATLSAANRAVIESSGLVVLVVERDPICVQSARRLAKAIESWIAAPQPVGMVILSRTPLVFPMSLAEIETELGRPALAVIPPEADLCLSAENAHMPLVKFLPESNVAGSLIALADRLTPARPQAHVMLQLG